MNFFKLWKTFRQNKTKIETITVNNFEEKIDFEENQFLEKIQNYILELTVEGDDEYLNKIKSKFKLTKETTYVYFNRNNLSYVYDKNNDNQYVFLRKLENSIQENNLFAISFNEMKMQSHSFACTNDINNK